MKLFSMIYAAIVLAGVSLYGLFEIKIWRERAEFERVDAIERAKITERESKGASDLLDEYTMMWADWKKEQGTPHWNDADEKLRRLKLATSIREVIAHPLVRADVKLRGWKLADEITATAPSKYAKRKS